MFDCVRSVRARSARIFHHFTFFVFQLRQKNITSHRSLIPQERITRKNQRSNTNSIMTKTELALEHRYDSQGDCNGDDECIWLDSSNECVPNCFVSYDDETSCDAASGCRWNATAGSGECTEDCTNAYSELISCSDDSIGCLWLDDVSSCVDACDILYQDESACDDDENCVYNSTLSSCLPVCEHIYESISCNERSDCEWREGICVDPESSDLSSSGGGDDGVNMLLWLIPLLVLCCCWWLLLLLFLCCRRRQKKEITKVITGNAIEIQTQETIQV